MHWVHNFATKQSTFTVDGGTKGIFFSDVAAGATNGMFQVTDTTVAANPVAQACVLRNDVAGNASLNLISAVGLGGFLDFHEVGAAFQGRFQYDHPSDTFNVSTAGVLAQSTNQAQVTDHVGKSLLIGSSATADPAVQNITMQNSVGGSSEVRLTSANAGFTTGVEFGSVGLANAGRVVYNPNDKSLNIQAEKTYTIAQTVAPVGIQPLTTVGAAYGTVLVDDFSTFYRVVANTNWDAGTKVTLTLADRGHYVIHYVAQANEAAAGKTTFTLTISDGGPAKTYVTHSNHIGNINEDALVGSGSFPYTTQTDGTFLEIITVLGTSVNNTSFFSLSGHRIA